MKKKILYLSCFLFVLFGLWGIGFVPVQAADAVATVISANPGQDANHQMRINWHADLTSENMYVQYTKKSDTAWAEAQTVMGTSVFNDIFTTRSSAIGANFLQWGAEINDLEEGTEYMYKVGSSENTMSSIYYFKTGSQSFDFCWISDIHAYYDDARRLNSATAVMNDIFRLNGGSVDFVLSTGDTAAHGGTYQWWQQLANVDWMKKYMYVDTIGNHDYMTSAGDSPANGASNGFFSSVHNFPKNGFVDSTYGDQNNICYYFYYGDVLFVNLSSAEYSSDQMTWCENVLKNNKAQYIVLMQHYGWFNDSGSNRSQGFTRWNAICDKYDVDFVFAGDSHVYMRTKPIYNGAPSNDYSKGTVYLNAPSSDGDRGKDMPSVTTNLDRIEKYWAGGVYQVAGSLVKVTPSGLTITLVNRGGAILDYAFYSAKRGPSERYAQSIGNFDKNKFAATVKYIQSPTVGLKGYVTFDPRAIDVLIRADLIVNQQIVFTVNNLDEIGAGFAVENRLANSKVRFLFIDGSELILPLSFVENTNWGTITEFTALQVGERVNLSWLAIVVDPSIKFRIYADGEQIAELPYNAGGYNTNSSAVYFEIIVINSLGEVIGQIDYLMISVDGDVNGDFVLDNNDLEILLGHLIVTGSISNLYIQDYNGDGRRDIADINWLQNAIKDGYIGEDTEYLVTFYDRFGNILSEQVVEYGEDAVAPNVEEDLINRFFGWSLDFTNVTKDLEIFPYYEIAAVLENLRYDTSLEIDVDINIQLQVSILNQFCISDLIWEIDDESIASISELGMLIFSKPGTVVVKVSSAVNPENYLTLELTCEAYQQIALKADYVVSSNTSLTEYTHGKLIYLINSPIVTTINEAISKTPEGGIVVVLPGTYPETIVLDKAITLTTLNRTTEVTAPRFNEAIVSSTVEISASNVELSGFVFSGAPGQTGVNCKGLIYTTGGKSLSNVNISYNDIIMSGTLGSHTGIIRIGNSAANTTFTDFNISFNRIHSGNAGQSGISNRNRDNTQASTAVMYRTIIVNGVLEGNIYTGAYFGNMNLELGASGSIRIINPVTTAIGSNHIVNFASGSGTVTIKGIDKANVKTGTLSITIVEE